MSLNNILSRIAHWKWRTLLGLFMVFIAVVFQLNWVWGLLFLYWILPSIRLGVTHFLEPLDKRENPILFWVVIATWVTVSILLIAEPLVWQLLENIT